jgi:hypothetical protein
MDDQYYWVVCLPFIRYILMMILLLVLMLEISALCMGCGDFMAHFVQLWHGNVSVSGFYCNYMRKWPSAVATYYMHTEFLLLLLLLLLLL